MAADRVANVAAQVLADGVIGDAVSIEADRSDRPAAGARADSGTRRMTRARQTGCGAGLTAARGQPLRGRNRGFELLHVPFVAPDLLIADHLAESSDPVTPTTESEDPERG